jgi:hypothetical protein
VNGDDVVGDTENFKQRVEKYRNSVEFKKNSYARRMTALLILPLWLFFASIAALVDRIFSLPDYLVYTIAFFLAMPIAVLVAEKEANKKFNNKSGDE